MQRGFSLVETLVATSLLTAALISMAQLLAAGSQNSLAARTSTATLLMAEQKMEELRAAPWAAVAATRTGTDYLDTSAHPACVGAPMACSDAAYVRRWSATASPFTTAILIIEVQVSPSGPAHGGALLVSAKARRSR